MAELWRRLKGAFGMGLTWAVAWIPIGVLMALGMWVVGLDPPGLLNFIGMYATVFGILGFVGGGLFSGVLRLAEGRRRFEELSLPRFAGWGALGGFVLGGLAVAVGLWGPGVSTLDIVIVGVSSLLGAGSAAGTLALARQADGGALAAGDAELEEIGLSEDERKQLLGGA